MFIRRTGRFLVIALLVLTAPDLLRSEAPGTKAGTPLLDSRALAARIDQLIAARWKARGVTPAPAADDAEFFRRLSLDLNGRIPSVAQLQDFLDDDRADKRRLWIDELLEGQDNADLYVNHFTNYWRTLFFSLTNNQQALTLGYQLEPWLRKHVKRNTPYDRLVRELLTSPEGASFSRANENKPENLAGNTARLFLGVRLECAQCHDDRSGGDWTRAQFWEFAAFFADARNRTAPPKIQIPGKKEWVAARFLNGGKLSWKDGDSPRTVLAGWLTAADNPYFARAAVNRWWHYFFGVGLTDPVDAMGTKENAPSHPEVLDLLAGQFTAHRFDLRYLIRAITTSQTYQRTSRLKDASQKDPRLFARAAVRGMSPEQLFDSLAEATGYRPKASAGGNAYFSGPDKSPRAEFLAKFANVHDQPAEVQTSILQALYFLNGKVVGDAASLAKSKTLKTVVNAAASVSTAKRIEELYLAVLSRKPRPEERKRLVKYVESGGPARDRKTALGDVFWALLNSTEFILNH